MTVFIKAIGEMKRGVEFLCSHRSSVVSDPLGSKTFCWNIKIMQGCIIGRCILSHYVRNTDTAGR